MKDYIAKLKAENAKVPNGAQIIQTIEAELLNIEGTINRTIDIIASDQKISYCVEGRDLSQINGGKRGGKNTTTARFPNLLNNQKMIIAAAALRQAQDNYNKKYTEEVSKATKEASADIAQVICHQMGSGNGGGGSADMDKQLIPPFSISYEIGQGVGIDALLAGGTGSTSAGASASATGTTAGISLTSIGYNSEGTKSEGNTTIKTRALFSRESRNCHYCKETITTSCSSSSSSGILGIGAKKSSSCDTKSDGEVCEDIVM